MWFYKNNRKINNVLADEIRKHRNELMHSTNMRLSSKSMADWLTDMVKLLHSLVDFQNRKQAVEAESHIKQIRDTSIEITATDEIKVMHEHLHALEQKMNDTNTSLEKLKDDCQQTSLDLQRISGDHRKDLNVHAKQIQDFSQKLTDQTGNYEQVQRDIQNMKKIIDQNSDMVKTMTTQFSGVNTQLTSLGEKLGETKSEVGRCSSLYSSLSSKVQQLEGTVSNIGQRMESVEQESRQVGQLKSAFEGIKQKMGTLDQDFKKIDEVRRTVGDVEERIDTLEQDSKTIAEVKCTVEVMEQKMDTVEYESKRVEQLETTVDGVEQKVDTVEQRVDTVEQRMDIMETMRSIHSLNSGLSVYKESRKAKGTSKLAAKRPDPKLMKLKEDTDMFIQSKVADGFVKTAQFLAAKDKLMKKGCVLITGKPGEGKTTSAAVIIKELFNDDRRVKLHKASDWECVFVSEVDVVFVDDIFGLYNLDIGKLDEWLLVFERIGACVKQKQISLIVCARANIVSECGAKLSRFDMFKHGVNFSSEKLSLGERKGILECKLSCTDKTLSASEIDECLRVFTCPIGFPYCCHLFTADPKLYEQKSKFFEKPYQFFVENIKNMDNRKLLAFICIFHKGGKLNHTVFSQTSNKEELKKLIEDIADVIGVDSIPRPGSVKSCIEHNCGVYIENMSDFYQFAHNVIYETVGLTFGKERLEDVIRYCTLDFLCECIDCDPDNKSEGVLIVPLHQFNILAERFIQEVVDRGEARRIAKHPALSQHVFVDALFKVLDEQAKTLVFLQATGSWEKSGFDLEFDKSILLATAGSTCKSTSYFVENAFLALNNSGDEGMDTAEKHTIQKKAFDATLQHADDSLSVRLIEKYVEFQSIANLADALQAGRIDVADVLVHHIDLTKSLSEYSEANGYDLNNVTRDIQRVLNFVSDGKFERIAVSLLSSRLVPLPEGIEFCLTSENVQLMQVIVNRIRGGPSLKAGSRLFHKTLNLACDLNHLEIMQELLAVGVEPSDQCILKAEENQRREIMDAIIRQIKQENVGKSQLGFFEICLKRKYTVATRVLLQELHRSGQWNTENEEICETLDDVLRLSDPQMKESVILTTVLKYAVTTNKLAIVQHVTNQLVQRGAWDIHSEDIHIALHEAIHLANHGNRDIVQHLLLLGGVLKRCCMKSPFRFGKTNVISEVIQQLVLEAVHQPSLLQHIRQNIQFQDIDDTNVSQLLDACIKSNLFDLVSKIFEAVKFPSLLTLKFAVLCGDKYIVQRMLKRVKENHVLHADNEDVKEIISYTEDAQKTELTEILFLSLDDPSPWCLTDAIKYCNEQTVSYLVKKLLDSKQWDINVGVFNRISDPGVKELILETNMNPELCYLVHAVTTGKIHIVQTVLHRLHDLGKLDPKDKDIHLALHSGLANAEITNAFIQAGMYPDLCCLTEALQNEHDQAIGNILYTLDRSRLDTNNSAAVHSALDLLKDENPVHRQVAAFLTHTEPCCLKYIFHFGDVSHITHAVKHLISANELKGNIGNLQKAIEINREHLCKSINNIQPLESILKLLSPFQPWCLKYALYCHDEVVLKHAIQDLDESSSLLWREDDDIQDHDIKDAVDAALDDAEILGSNKVQLILQAVLPPKELCFQYILESRNKRKVNEVIHYLTDTEQWGLYDYDRHFTDRCKNILYFIKYLQIEQEYIQPYLALCCNCDEVVAKLLQIRPESIEWKCVLKVLVFAYSRFRVSLKNLKLVISELLPVNPAASLALTFLSDSHDQIVKEVTNTLQITQHHSDYTETIRSSLDMIPSDLFYESNPLLELVLCNITSPRLGCLRYAMRCSEHVLKDYIKGLIKINQWYNNEVAIQEEIRAVVLEDMDRLRKHQLGIVLLSVKLTKLWCLTYALMCNEAVLRSVIQNLQDSDQWNDTDSIRDAIGALKLVKRSCFRQLEFLVDRNLLGILVCAVSPARPWCLTYALMCNEAVLRCVIQNAQDSDQWNDTDSIHDAICAVKEITGRHPDTNLLGILVGAVSPARPWCLTYALVCNEAVLRCVIQNLQDSDQWNDTDSILDAIGALKLMKRSCFGQLEFLVDKNLLGILLCAVSPAKPWCLTYALMCNEAVLRCVIQNLQDSDQWNDTDSIRDAIGALKLMKRSCFGQLEFLVDKNLLGILLCAVSPAKPWCLTYALMCNEAVLRCVIQNLQDSDQWNDTDSIRDAIGALKLMKRSCFGQLEFLGDKNLLGILVCAVSPAKPWCLTYALMCNEAVLRCVIQNAQDSDQWNDTDSIQDAICAVKGITGRHPDTNMLGILVCAVSPARQWCLTYALMCNEAVLRCVIQNLQDSDQWNDTDSIRDAIGALKLMKRSCFGQLEFLVDKNLLGILLCAVSPAKPWCLTYALMCNEAVLRCVIQNAQDSDQWNDTDSIQDAICAVKGITGRHPDTNMLGILVCAVSPARQWCLTYALMCNEAVLRCVIQNLQDSNQWNDTDSILDAICAVKEITGRHPETNLLGILVCAVSPARPWCLTYALVCNEAVLRCVIQNLQDSDQWNDTNSIHDATCAVKEITGTYPDKNLLGILVCAISPVQPWCLTYALVCIEAVLRCVIQNLQDSDQWNDRDSIHDAICAVKEITGRDPDKNLLGILVCAVSPARPWCLTYAVMCNNAVLRQVIIDLQGTNQWNIDDICDAVSNSFKISGRFDTELLDIVFQSVSPITPSCIQYALYCNEITVQNVIQALNKSSEGYGSKETFCDAVDAYVKSYNDNNFSIKSQFSCMDDRDGHKRSKLMVMLQNVSPIHMWHLRYALLCNNVSLLKQVILRLQANGEWDQNQDGIDLEIQHALKMCRKGSLSTLEYLLTILPASLLRLKFALYCSQKSVKYVVSELKKQAMPSESCDINVPLNAYFEDRTCIIDWKKVNIVLQEFIPTQPWLVGYLVYCSEYHEKQMFQRIQPFCHLSSGKQLYNILEYAVNEDENGESIYEPSILKLILTNISPVTVQCFRFGLYCDGKQFIQTIISRLQESGLWDTSHDDIHTAADKCPRELIQYVLIPLKVIKQPRPCCLQFLVQYCKLNNVYEAEEEEENKLQVSENLQAQQAVLSSTIQKLKSSHQWDGNNKYVHDLLHCVLGVGSLSITNLLLDAGACLKLCCLEVSVASDKIPILKLVMDSLISSNQWNSNDEYVYKAFESSLSCGNTKAMKMLLKKNIQPQQTCLRVAVLSKKQGMVKDVIEILKRYGIWDQNHKDIHRALRASIGNESPQITEMIIKAMSPCRPCCFRFAVTTDKKDFIQSLLHQSKTQGLWEGGNSDLHGALEESIKLGKFKIAEVFLNAGITLHTCCLSYAVHSGQGQVVERVLRILKQTNSFETKHEDIHEAVQIALDIEKSEELMKYRITGLIFSALEKPLPCCMKYAVATKSTSIVASLFEKLKQGGHCVSTDQEIHTAFKIVLSESTTFMITTFLNFGVSFKQCCITAAANQGSLTLVTDIIQRLKTSQQWDISSSQLHSAIHFCICKGYINLVELLVMEGLVIKPCCLPDTVILGNVDFLQQVLGKLQNGGQLDLENEDVHKAFELSLEFGDSKIVEHLRNTGVTSALCCLLPAVKSGKEGVVKDVIKWLKEDNNWNDNHIAKHPALRKSSDHDNIPFLEIILKEEIPPRACCLRHVVKTGNESLVKWFISDLEGTGNWDGSLPGVHEALHVCLSENQMTIAKILLSAGVGVRVCCLWHAVYSEEEENVVYVIQILKQTGKWGSCDEELHEAIALCVDEGQHQMKKRILDAFETPKECCLKVAHVQI